MRLFCVLLVAASLGAAEKPIVMHWDASNLTLSWVSTKDRKTKHVIDFKTRTMDANGKSALRFSEEERHRVLSVLGALLDYAVESEDWHSRGGVYQEVEPEQSRSPKRLAGNRNTGR